MHEIVTLKRQMVGRICRSEMTQCFRTDLLSVFPADAGMNRHRRAVDDPDHGVPRGRGDEPRTMPEVLGVPGCSPRTRG